MILTERTITIIDNASTIDSPVVLYRGDKNVELKLNIKESRFQFRDDDSTNLIETTQASYGQLVIQTPNQNEPIFSEVTATKKGYIIFVITAEMIDEVTEVGDYSFQVRLLDSNKISRATIPPVFNGIEIREPITAEDSNSLNSAVVGLASAADEEVLDTFDINGNYDKTDWKFGDKITAAKLNKSEDGIYQSYALGLNNSSKIKDIANEKATKQEVELERQRINNIVSLPEGSTTGDAELADGRIGVDGITYDNIGSAIRGQVNMLKNGLDKIITPLDIAETVGYYFGSNGELISDTTATNCCYTNKIRVYNGSKIIWEIGNFQYRHYLWGAYILYDENENVIGTRKEFVNTSTEVDYSDGVISIPNNAKYIAFTYRTFGESNVFSAKNLYSKDLIEQLLLTVDENKDDLDNLKYFNYDMLNGRKGWIKHGTGQYYYSDATKCYVFNKNNLTHFKAFLRSDTDVIDGISFFSGTEISEGTYLDSSIAWKGNYQNGAWYDVTIPKDANLICVTSGIQNGFVPKILFSTDEVLGVTDNKYKNSIELNTNNIVKLQKDIHSKNDIALYGLDRYIYHFGMEEVAIRTETPPVVPSQSIYDVQYAKKLGYKCIEGNLHKTLDGKYVVTHGLNGCLGHDFDDLQGNDAYGVVIAETSFETLRNNYRYRSSNENYRVAITSLEEFCAEVKKEGLVLMLQYKDMTSLNIARGILGDNNLFMYNAPRQDYDGAILEYLYYNTKEEILNRCRLVGRPYIYSMDNPSKFDDDTLKDIVNSLHEEGFYIASAYVGDGKKYLKMGFDFIARDGKSKELGDNEIVIDNKVLTFNLDGSVSWRDL